MQATNNAATVATVAEHQQGVQPRPMRSPNSQILRSWPAAPAGSGQAALGELTASQEPRFRRTQYKYLFARIIGLDHAREHFRSDHDCVSGTVLDLCARGVFPVPG